MRFRVLVLAGLLVASNGFTSSLAAASNNYDDAFQMRLCERIGRRFGSNERMILRVHKRIQKRFGFTCNHFLSAEEIAFKTLHSGIHYITKSRLPERIIDDQDSLEEFWNDFWSSYIEPPVEEKVPNIDFSEQTLVYTIWVDSSSMDYVINSVKKQGSVIHVYPITVSGCTVTTDGEPHYTIISLPRIDVDNVTLKVHSPERVYTTECP